MIQLPKFKDIAWFSKQVATRSAMNSNLWQSAISTPFAIVACLFAPEPLNYLILALGAVPVLIGQGVFVFFAKTDPKRLQSEAHVERMENIAPRLGTNASGKTVEIELTVDQPSTNNPLLSDGSRAINPEDLR
jgi:hypothetical protein